MALNRQTKNIPFDLVKITDAMYGETDDEDLSAFFRPKDMRRASFCFGDENIKREGKDYNTFGKPKKADT